MVPGVLALLPHYRSQADPVAELRLACCSAVGWLGPEVEVLADEQGARVADWLLAETTVIRRDPLPSYLVVANGSARRSESAPGYLDPRAQAWDAELRQFLVGEAPLPDLALGRELLAATTGIELLAERATDLRHPRIDYEDDPFGVQYWVMRWMCGS